MQGPKTVCRSIQDMKAMRVGIPQFRRYRASEHYLGSIPILRHKGTEWHTAYCKIDSNSPLIY